MLVAVAVLYRDVSGSSCVVHRC